MSTPMKDSEKKWIDEANYEKLLRKWRFAPAGEEIFQGESGVYYADVLAILRAQVGENEHTRVSKEIGWTPK